MSSLVHVAMPPKKSPTKATAATSKSPATVATAQKASASNPAVSKVDTKPVARTTANRATRGGGATVQRGPSRGGTAGRGRAVATRGRGRGGSPAGKQGEQVKGKAGGNDRASVKVGKPVWTREDGAARRIQTVYRRYRAKKELAARRKEKEEYDALMDKLQREVRVSVTSLFIIYLFIYLFNYLFNRGYIAWRWN